VNPVILCLAIGALIGPLGLGLIAPDLALHSRHIEAVTQVVLLFALFGAGLRMRMRFDRTAWRLPARFALVSTIGTLLLIAVAAHLCFDLDWRAALLLGAILAPTDPALTAEVRLPGADDELRGLLGLESTFGALLGVPLVLLALDVFGGYGTGRDGVRWLGIDLVWALAGGLAVGWFIGTLSWRKLVRPQGGRDVEVPDELIAVGTIAVACGVAMLLQASPLAAVFAAGLALSHGGRFNVDARMARTSPRLEAFTARLERFGLTAALLLLGALLTPANFRPDAVIFAVILLTLLRPIAARIGLLRAPLAVARQRLAAWFGMRGIVSIYLLSVAINQGMDAGSARTLTGIVVVMLIASIALHEVTAAPLTRRRADQRA
jgi:sodium/hydrogen antiporter